MNEIAKRRLDQKIQELPRELSPERDLWPDIQASINSDYGKEKNLRFERFYPLAAAAVLVLFIGSGLNYFNENQSASSVAGQLTDQYSDFADIDSGMLINAGYKQVRNVLVEDLVSRLEALSPADKIVIETNMARIDAALAEINTALKSDPENMLLQRLLMSAYSDNLTLFGEINSITRTLDERVQL